MYRILLPKRLTLLLPALIFPWFAFSSIVILNGLTHENQVLVFLYRREQTRPGRNNGAIKRFVDFV